MKIPELIKVVREEARRRGIRWTSQRQIIVETFASLDEHITAEELHRRVRAVDTAVSAATVYRTVNLLVELGVADKGHFGNGSASFEMAWDKDHHDHLVCESCGLILEFHNEKIEQLQREVAAQHQFRLNNHRMELYGICPACQATKDEDDVAASKVATPSSDTV